MPKQNLYKLQTLKYLRPIKHITINIKHLLENLIYIVYF